MELAAYLPPFLLRGLNKFEFLKPLDSIYTGEIYCDRKHEDMESLLQIVAHIKHEGKKVYISTPVLLSTDEVLKNVYKHFEWAEEGIVDAVLVNDLGALEIGIKEYPTVPIFLGPFIDIRNALCAKVFQNFGAKRIALPYDLPLNDVKEIVKSVDLEVEIQVHGAIPLLVSRRCYLMRAQGIKEGGFCKFLCEKYKDGMEIATVNSDYPFLTLGGRVAYSSKDFCLLESIPQIKKSGVKVLRIEEWNSLRPEIYQIYKSVIEGENIEGKLLTLEKLSPHGLCNGWFFGSEGYKYRQGNESIGDGSSFITIDSLRLRATGADSKARHNNEHL